MSSMGVEVISSDKKELIEAIEDALDLMNNQYIKNLFLNTIRGFENNYNFGKQNKKVLISLYHAVNMINENISKNKKINNKYLMCEENSVIPYIDELMEGVILAIKEEYEEKKYKYYGYLLGNILFYDDLDRDQCNRLIRVTKTLSYCQIKLIHMYIISQTIQVPILKREDYTKSGISDYKLLGLLQDTLDMIQKGLLNGSGKLILDVVQINPSQIRVQGIGTLIYNLISINKMPYDELEDLLEVLSK